MNSAIEILNHWGGSFLDFACTIFWQSSVLVLLLLVLDFGLRHRVRASVRHGLWLVLLVKLVLPTDLALPTSPAWWWSRATAVQVVEAPMVKRNVIVTESDNVLVPDVVAPAWTPPVPPPPVLTLAAGSLLLVGVVSGALLGWLLWRWWQVVRTIRAAWSKAELAVRVGEARDLAGLRSPVPVKVTPAAMSPAVCGLFRPVILLPQALVDKLSPEQLRAVLLHELIHVRRGDVWVNFAQALLQIVYWWHPLVWLANSRIRRAREEAVDEAVMVALRGEAEVYAPALLTVAKLALHRPRTSLGLVGILESRSALRQRIERLVNFPVPRRAGLGVLGALGIVAFSAVALPMGEAPPLPAVPVPSVPATNNASPTTLVFKTYALSAETGLPQLRQQTGLTAESPASDYLAAFTKLLAASGHTLPTNSLWLADQGLLLVRGTPAELAEVAQLFRGLNGFPPAAVKSPASSSPPPPAKSVELGGENGATNLFQRTFKINANTFCISVQKALGTNGPIEPKALTGSLRVLFGRFGVNLAAPKSLFYNDRLGMILVIGTEMDLDAIERIVESLSQPTLTNTATPDDHDQAGTLLQDGKVLYEMGKLAEAEAKLKAAIKLDPNNAAAFYYLNLVQQAQYVRSSGNQTSFGRQPIVNELASNRLAVVTYSGPGRQAIAHKLESIRLAAVAYHGLPLHEVLRQLSQSVREQDPEKTGLNFLIGPDSAASPQPGFITSPADTAAPEIDPATGLPVSPATNTVDAGNARIDLQLTNASLATILDSLVRVAEPPIKYSIQDFAIVFSPKLPEAEPLLMRNFKVSEDALKQTLGAKENPRAGVVSNLTSVMYIRFLPSELRECFKARGVNLDPPKNLFFNDRLGLLYVKATSTDLDAIGRIFGFTNSPASLPTSVPSPSSTNGILSNPNFKAAIKALEQRSGVENLAEPEVTTTTSGRGVNRITLPLQLDLPAALAPTNLPLTEAAETNQLFMRTFKVNAIDIWRALETDPDGLMDTNGKLKVGRMLADLRQYFSYLGVNLNPPKAVFYNDKLGLLFVKASEPDLDIIENWVEKINVVTPQVHIKSYFIEVPGEIGEMKAFATHLDPKGQYLTGILPAAQTKQFLRQIEARPGVEILAESEATSSSGRQTQMRATEMLTMVTGIKASPDGQNHGDPLSFITSKEEFGPVIDVVPYVLQDGYTINLTVIPSETVFDGYDDAPTNANLSTIANHTVALHPHIFVREYVTSRNLYDGQTMLIYETQPRPVSFKSPDFTQAITNMYQSGKASHLLVLTTVSIVDSAGKQVHADEEMPFAQDRVPPQPAPAVQDAPFEVPNIPHLRATPLITPVGDWPFDTPTTLPAGGVKGGFDGPIR